MERFSQSKIIIFFISALMLVASVYLFAISSNYTNSDMGWWVASFNDPKSDNLNFSIENFSSNSAFHWEVMKNSEKISEGEITVDRNSKKEISIDNAAGQNEKMTIRVVSGKETREIYKQR